MPLPISILRSARIVAKTLFCALALSVYWLLSTTCWSGTEVINTPVNPTPNQIAPGDLTSNPPSKSAYASLFGENVVSLSVETAGLFSLNNPNNYSYLPQLITIGWQLDEIGNEGWARGNVEFLFSGMYAPVTQGPNPWFAGGLFGPRYNFIQEDCPVIPYFETRVGFVFTHATGAPNSQGQDFCFSFTLGAGIRIPIENQLSANLGVLYQHISNGGLSEPAHPNVGLDSIGPVFSVTWAF